MTDNTRPTDINQAYVMVMNNPALSFEEALARVQAGKAKDKAASLYRNEAQFQQAVIDEATALGWKVYHTTYSIGSDRGYPDLTMVHPEHGALWLELKGPRTPVRPEQEVWLQALRDAGQKAHLVHSHEMHAIAALLRGEEVEA